MAAWRPESGPDRNRDRRTSISVELCLKIQNHRGDAGYFCQPGQAETSLNDVKRTDSPRRAPDNRRSDLQPRAVDSRHRRAAGAHHLRAGDVLLHLLSFLQPRAREHLLRPDGEMAVVSYLVVADSGGQHRALYRGLHASFARIVGALPAAAFSLRRRRTHATCAWPEYSALAREPFRRRAGRGRRFGGRSAQLRKAAVRLLGVETAHDRGAVHAFDRCVDPCVHRDLFLAAAEAVFQMGAAVSLRDRRLVAAACNDRPASRRRGSRPARFPDTMAHAIFDAIAAAPARAHRRDHAVLFSDRLSRRDTRLYSLRVACAVCASAAVE